jgi:hypothetical protein
MVAGHTASLMIIPLISSANTGAEKLI